MTDGFNTGPVQPVPFVPAGAHDPVPAERVMESHRYSFRNHSYEYNCPACGRIGRFNSNFLGRRVVTCDGLKFTLVKRETPDEASMRMEREYLDQFPNQEDV